MQQQPTLKIAAKWATKTSGPVRISEKPRTVMQIRGTAEVELRTLRVVVEKAGPGADVLTELVEQEPSRQGRRLPCRGEAVVIACEPAASPDPGAQPLYANSFTHPHDYWQFCGRVEIPKGRALGVVVRVVRVVGAAGPVRCRVIASGG